MKPLNRYLDQLVESMLLLPFQPLEVIAEVIWETYQRDGTIYICGNGGSASTASHFACDLAKWTIQPDMRRVRALALTESMPLMTAWSNDQSYADIFVEQLATHYRPGDMVFAISGSGNSENVLRAVGWANRAGAPTAALCGFDGGQLFKLARHCLRVDNYHMPQIEDMHSMLCHALAVNLGKRIEAGLPDPRARIEPAPLMLLERSLGGTSL